MPEPELADFLEPLPPLTYTIPEPEISLEYPQTAFNYFENFNKFYLDSINIKKQK